MNIPRVMLAAPKSGSGKTTITCGMLQALKNQKMKVCAFKCGPDYIDPMFHEMVLGIPSRNLDTFFTGETGTRQLFLKHSQEKELAVMEGVMGLFDGLGGVREEGSSYHLAKITKTPIVLIIDGKGMGQSILPIIAGFLAYDPEHLIRGIILNRTTKYSFERLRPMIEAAFPVKALGYLPENKQTGIASRHLGLLLPEEIPDLQENMKQLAAQICDTISMEDLLKIAQGAEPLIEERIVQSQMKKKQGPLLAVAKDEAFCFYYKENLELLQFYGAKLCFFSPIHDQKLPENCAGILLGGGYPELYAKELGENEAMREAIRRAFQKNIPMIAECGGFMYLHQALVTKEGIRYPMAGALDGEVFDTGKTVRFGYIEVEGEEPSFLEKGSRIKGHEFHYYDSTTNGTSCIAMKPVTKQQYACIHGRDSFFLGFPHLYYPSQPEFAKNFVRKAEEYQQGFHCKEEENVIPYFCK